MKKQTSKKLSLGKIKIASLHTTKQEAQQAIVTSLCTSPSQIHSICSEDSCRF